METVKRETMKVEIPTVLTRLESKILGPSSLKHNVTLLFLATAGPLSLYHNFSPSALDPAQWETYQENKACLTTPNCSSVSTILHLCPLPAWTE